MICWHCNKEIDDDALFCPECGKNVAEGPPSEKQGVVPEKEKPISRKEESVLKKEDVHQVKEEPLKQDTVTPKPKHEELHPDPSHEKPEKQKMPGALFGGIGAVLLVIIVAAVLIKSGVFKKGISYENAIDAVHNSKIAFRGVVISEQEGYQLSVMEPAAPFSVCAVNMEGKEKRADNLYSIGLSSVQDLSFYQGKEVWMGGELCIDDGQVLMYVDTIEDAQTDMQQAKEPETFPVDEGTESTEPEYVEETMEQTEEQTESETELSRSEEEIHRYVICVEDCTWSEAFERCKEMGGYLVRINTKKEFSYIRDLIVEGGYEKKQFYIGMRRDPDGDAYYLVDEDNEFIGERMDNGYTEWCEKKWLQGEPTYRESTLGIDETCVSMFLYSGSGKWVWNDVPEDLIGALSSNAGKIGYICEIE